MKVNRKNPYIFNEKFEVMTNKIADVTSTDVILSPLIELGLNKYEAKVYLTLVSEGISTAKNLSDITGIPYGKVYEIINSLANKGFSMLLPTKPLKCKAIHPRDALLNVKKKTEERYKKLEKKIIQHLEPLFKEDRLDEQKNSLWVIHGRSNINKKIEELLNKVKEYVYIISSENGIKRLVIFKEFFENIKKNNGEIKIIGKITKDNIEDVASLVFCDFNHINETLCHLIIVDGKECLVIEPLPDDDNILYGRDIAVWIFSNNFVKLFESVFDAKLKVALPLIKRTKQLKINFPPEEENKDVT